MAGCAGVFNSDVRVLFQGSRGGALQDDSSVADAGIVLKRREEINKKPFESKQNGTKDLSQRRRPLVDRIVEIADQSNNFNDEDIIQEVCTFMLAGQESVATAVTFTLFLLAKHPDVLSRALDEVDAVLGELPDVPTLGALRKLCYTEQCIKETLRLYPSVPIVARTLSEDVSMGKVTLPKGCQVIITPYATHRIPHIYPDPEKFDPDRFLPENMRGRHQYAYIPFSAGPRICIGYKFAMLEMKMLLGEILRKYHVTTIPGKEELRMKYRITIRASGGVWLQFTPRAAQLASDPGKAIAPPTSPTMIHVYLMPDPRRGIAPPISPTMSHV
uniref:Cytochrome P450 n=1 Tax=Timema genevievae TaxID=629358 RepID=A0A7R9PKU0_TIMGE|nr:unnamed protein product [Timema genevievae]